jgi:hypothetical protein
MPMLGLFQPPQQEVDLLEVVQHQLETCQLQKDLLQLLVQGKQGEWSCGSWWCVLWRFGRFEYREWKVSQANDRFEFVDNEFLTEIFIFIFINRCGHFYSTRKQGIEVRKKDVRKK